MFTAVSTLLVRVTWLWSNHDGRIMHGRIMHGRIMFQKPGSIHCTEIGCNVFQLNKTNYYLSKNILKSNSKHVPVDGVVRAQNKWEIHNFLLTGEVTGKTCTRHCKTFKKISITFENAWLPSLFMLWNGSGKPIQCVIVSGCEQKMFRLYFSWTRGRLSEMLKILLQRFCYWNHTNNGFCASIHHDVLRSLLICLLFSI